MRSSFISAAVLAFAASVLGQVATDGFDQITAPLKDQNVVAGKSFDIVWLPGNYTDDSITVTIDLLQGKTAQSLDVGKNIAKGVSNKLGKFSWNVPADAVGFETYGLRIKQDDIKSTTKDESTVFQYSFPFHITSGSSGAQTLTVQLGTGSAYVPAPTSTTVVSTTKNVTSSTSASTSASPKPSSNATIATTISTTRPTATGPSATSSSPPQQSSSAAVANVVSGSIALIGGALIAFAL